MIHLWLRAEQRENEKRTGLTPKGVGALVSAGFKISVEASDTRVIPTHEFARAGACIVDQGSWPDAPRDAVILGLKELPEDGSPLCHRHIMFGHAFKGQAAGRVLLNRFRDGGGRLYDLEYLTDTQGRRVAAFGYWAGYAGAAVALKCWGSQQRGAICEPLKASTSKAAMISELAEELDNLQAPRPTAIVIGALGRVGSGAGDLCADMGVTCTRWDIAETARGGPFPEIMDHDIFLNAILARPGTPVFVPQDALQQPRKLSVIGDISCDPGSDFSPIKVYDRATDWAAPARRIHCAPPLDVTAIDNLPSLLPLESSLDFADQLLPSLLALGDLSEGVWANAGKAFDLNV